MKNQFNETGTDFGKTQSLPKLRKYELIQDFPFPWIVKPGYFVQMGFSDVFVRQYVKKHDKAAKPNGEIICGVRGVFEADFILALAKAIRAYTPNSNRMQSHLIRMRLCAEACLAALDRIERSEPAKASRITQPVN
jgi:hypothetical protein